MIMSGDLEFVNSQLLFQHLENNRKTVTIKVGSGGKHRLFYFYQGTIVWVSSELPEEHPGNWLAGRSLISPGELEEYLRESKAKGEQFTVYLLKACRLKRAELTGAIEEMARQIILATFGEARGAFQVFSGIPDEVTLGKIRLSAKVLIDEFHRNRPEPVREETPADFPAPGPATTAATAAEPRAEVESAGSVEAVAGEQPSPPGEIAVPAEAAALPAGTAIPVVATEKQVPLGGSPSAILENPPPGEPAVPAEETVLAESYTPVGPGISGEAVSQAATKVAPPAEFAPPGDAALETPSTPEITAPEEATSISIERAALFEAVTRPPGAGTPAGKTPAGEKPPVPAASAKRPGPGAAPPAQVPAPARTSKEEAKSGLPAGSAMDSPGPAVAPAARPESPAGKARTATRPPALVKALFRDPEVLPMVPAPFEKRPVSPPEAVPDSSGLAAVVPSLLPPPSPPATGGVISSSAAGVGMDRGTLEKLKLLLLKRDPGVNLELDLLPRIAIQILRRLNDSSFNEKELSYLIQSSPELTARLLRHFHLPLYGLGRQAGTVQRAIELLGFEKITRMVLALSCRHENRCGPFIGQCRQLKASGVRTAYIAHDMAFIIGKDVEEFFLLGLLYRFGSLIAISLLEKKLQAGQLERIARWPELLPWLRTVEMEVLKTWKAESGLPPALLERMFDCRSPGGPGPAKDGLLLERAQEFAVTLTPDLSPAAIRHLQQHADLRPVGIGPDEMIFLIQLMINSLQISQTILED